MIDRLDSLELLFGNLVRKPCSEVRQILDRCPIVSLKCVWCSLATLDLLAGKHTQNQSG